uniref:Integrase catalytic domain-containing protein n=1 Tax=Nothobranchius furzeri TaxID=105023 RepID=A0A8C6KZA5_NOTFU
MVSGRGPQFTARFWKAFCSLMGASVSLSSRYHPQTNGQMERVNQQLGRYLRCFVSAQPSQWPTNLLWAELSHNLHTSLTTHMSPFKVCYGYQPPVLAHQEPEVAVPAAQSLVRCCKNAWIKARASITRANARYAHQHLRRHRPGPSYVPGDKVWVSTAGLCLRAGSKKLAPRFLGPYTVQKVINPVSYQLRLPATLRIHPTFHTSLLKPFVESSLLLPLAPATPPAHFLDGEPIYTIQHVLDACRRGRGWQYLVDWADYGPEERSWELARSILDPSLISDFWDRRGRPGTLGAVPGPGGPVRAQVPKPASFIKPVSTLDHNSQHAPCGDSSTSHLHHQPRLYTEVASPAHHSVIVSSNPQSEYSTNLPDELSTHSKLCFLPLENPASPCRLIDARTLGEFLDQTASRCFADASTSASVKSRSPQLNSLIQPTSLTWAFMNRPSHNNPQIKV